MSTSIASPATSDTQSGTDDRAFLFQWQSKLADNQRGKHYVGVLFAIARYINNDSGEGWAYRTALIEATGLSPSTVKRHIRDAEADGWIVRTEIGSSKLHRATTYKCLIPQWAAASPRPHVRAALNEDSASTREGLAARSRIAHEATGCASEELRGSSDDQGVSSEPLGGHPRAPQGVSSEPPTTPVLLNTTTQVKNSCRVAPRSGTDPRIHGERTDTPMPLHPEFEGNIATRKVAANYGFDHDRAVDAFHVAVAETPGFYDRSNWGGVFTSWIRGETDEQLPPISDYISSAKPPNRPAGDRSAPATATAAPRTCAAEGCSNPLLPASMSSLDRCITCAVASPIGGAR